MDGVGDSLRLLWLLLLVVLIKSEFENMKLQMNEFPGSVPWAAPVLRENAWLGFRWILWIPWMRSIQHSKILHQILNEGFKNETRQSKHCGFSIYIFDNSKSMVRLVRAERMVLSGLVFARKIARMILIQNIQGLLGPLMINMAFMPLYMWEMWDVTPVTHGHTDGRTNSGK